ncbi:alpha/beta fold hydrolase [Cohnella sp. WQ 127256]|uniref:alpha/beta fold hydrolase n=1 Tax=Cohnella sp. WQ 127256 TaxID=2938790 RepID=UPI0021193A1B|nr:alpha/beta fold hydrolase [Cohnella sp. WQ 127256]
MKKIALLLSIALLLTTFPAMASAAGIKVIVNDKAITFSDAQPYQKGNDLWIPLRQVAQALGMKIGFTQSTNKVELTKASVKIVFKIGSAEAAINNGKPISFATAAVLKQNRVYVPTSFFSKVLGLTATYHADRAEAVISVPKGADDIPTTIVNQLTAGAYQQLSDDYFDESIKPILTVKALQTGWEQIGSAVGDFVGIQSIEQNPNVTDYKEIKVLIAFSKANLNLNLKLNDQNKIISLMLVPAETPVTPVATPEGLVEETVVIGAGTKYPLPGTLTLPKNASGPVAAVILVHGSGAQDRDETINGNKPFRDIAWGLAQQGIAVLRYDKRTFAHGQSFTPDMLTTFTVKDETVDDAIAASKLIKDDKRIDASQVYIVGHSLGGMLAPRIDAEGGNFAGLVILAGSTRPLWEIITDQNMDIIKTIDDKDPAKKASEALVAAELLKAQNLSKLSDSEAIKQQIFGLPALYFKEMDAHSTKDFVNKLTKPILVLQGEDDFQVYAKDFTLWKDQLKGNAKASFKLYPGLSHLFINYSGEGENTLEEYKQPGTVDSQFIQDIADWINKK